MNLDSASHDALIATTDANPCCDTVPLEDAIVQLSSSPEHGTEESDLSRTNTTTTIHAAAPRMSSDHAPARDMDTTPSTPAADSRPTSSLFPPLTAARTRPAIARHPLTLTWILSDHVIIQPKSTDVSFRKINVLWPAKPLAAICGSSAANQKTEASANGSLIMKTANRTQTKPNRLSETSCLPEHQSRHCVRP